MHSWGFQDINNSNMYNYKNIFNGIQICNTAVPETDKTKQFGFLVVTVLAADETPIENALVTVYIMDRFSGEAPVQFATTNANGDTAKLTVPTGYILSNIIGKDFYFTSYNIRVDALGYYSSQINNIRFYPGVTTTFNITLHPIPLKIPGLKLEQRLQLPSSTFD